GRCCSPWPMMASAGQIPSAAAFPGSGSGSAQWTGKWTSPARQAGRPRSGASSRSRGEGGAQMRVVVGRGAGMMRGGPSRLLTDRGHEVCAAVADSEALLEAVAAHRPDAAVVDIRMPPTHTDEGLRAALELRDRFPQTGVLVFSQYIETRYSSQLLRGGV